MHNDTMTLECPHCKTIFLTAEGVGRHYIAVHHPEAIVSNKASDDQRNRIVNLLWERQCPPGLAGLAQYMADVETGTANEPLLATTADVIIEQLECCPPSDTESLADWEYDLLNEHAAYLPRGLHYVVNATGVPEQVQRGLSYIQSEYGPERSDRWECM